MKTCFFRRFRIRTDKNKHIRASETSQLLAAELVFQNLWQPRLTYLYREAVAVSPAHGVNKSPQYKFFIKIEQIKYVGQKARMTSSQEIKRY